MSRDALAAELNLTGSVVRAWEEGRISPSRTAERWLKWRVAMLDRDDALAASGLPECEELKRLATGSTEHGAERGDRIISHMAACPTCLARRNYLAERFPPLPPPPLPWHLTALVAVYRAVAKMWGSFRSKADPH